MIAVELNIVHKTTTTFTIIAKSIANFKVDAIGDQTYTGSAITPPVVISDGENTLVVTTDYTLSYEDNINVGKATVTITGEGNYSGTKKENFTIIAKSIADLTVKPIADQTYTGSAITPAIEIKYGGLTLVEGVDYTVVYTNNINVGTATVTVTGKGNYSGTKKFSFTIVAGAVSAANSTVVASPKSVVADNITTSTITVTLKDAFGNLVSGKKVSLEDNSATSTISAASGSSDANGVVTFKVRNGIIETVTYTAIGDGVVIKATATVEYTVSSPVSATNSTVVASPATGVLADGIDFSTITVTLRDANGSAVLGKTVNLSDNSTTSTISAASGSSDIYGVVTFTVKNTRGETVPIQQSAIT